MKKIVLAKSLMYILFFVMFFSAIYIENTQNKMNRALGMILSFPISLLLANIIHESGHIIFAKFFSCRVTSIKIGILKLQINPFDLFIEESGLLSGKCGLLLKNTIPLWKKNLIIMGGIYSNIIFWVQNLLLYFHFKDSITICIVLCCILNILANGLYSRSPDRTLWNIIKSKK